MNEIFIKVEPCWPAIDAMYGGLICRCGNFQISDVRWEVAKDRWFNHLFEQNFDTSYKGKHRDLTR